MIVSQKLMSVEEFLEFTQQPENRERFLELVAGVPVEMPPASKRNTVVAMRIGRFLGNFTDDRDLGYTTGADGGY